MCARLVALFDSVNLRDEAAVSAMRTHVCARASARAAGARSYIIRTQRKFPVVAPVFSTGPQDGIAGKPRRCGIRCARGGVGIFSAPVIAPDSRGGRARTLLPWMRRSARATTTIVCWRRPCPTPTSDSARILGLCVHSRKQNSWSTSKDDTWMCVSKRLRCVILREPSGRM